MKRIPILLQNMISSDKRTPVFVARFTVAIFFLFAACVFPHAKAGAAFSQTPDIVEHIRIPLWAELDAYPGLAEAQDTSAGVFDYSIARLKTLAPFIIGGMVYGWNFSYTPSDKLRGVEEYMDFSPVRELGEAERNITYAKPRIEDDKVYCWAEFTRTESMIGNYYLWASITNDTVHGIGYGKISDGFDGITNAVRDAIKNAVRAYFRTKIKNKPKEIRGKVLLRREPLIGIDAGRYKVQLDFFLETDKILPYTQF